MRAVIQRVKRAEVEVEGRVTGSIGRGLLVFVGVEERDSTQDGIWLTGKIAHLRIFNDDDGVMNLSVVETGGDILVVSQFTLHANVRKGNRPSYNRAAKPEKAIPLYREFLRNLESKIGRPVQTGEFGKVMSVSLLNDGPVTILIDSRE
ncbi:MAG TPA: D-aminoacyl-tRNA deacylase [Spirochaetia bacterium]|nr:D-aminoacyl-tRNA deacylase [Spirochaetia bacterium]